MNEHLPPSGAPEAAEGEYTPVLRFARAHPALDYYRFDWCCVHELNLFALRESFDFAALEETVDHVIDALPAIRRILSKPVIHLRQAEEILPAESVKVINNRTIIHASVHSELWEDITEDDTLKPRRLMTECSEDEYAIYENIVLTRLIGRVMAYLRENIRVCKDLLYADRVLDVNVLDREDHLYHLLAVGKMHTGYVRGFDAFRTTVERCLERMMFAYNALRIRLRCPLVTACRKRTEQPVLRRTNLFRMHKDYHAVYRLAAFWGARHPGGEAETVEPDLREGYPVFLSALALFAAGHFNFTAEAGQTFDLADLHVDLTFDRWRLNLSAVRAGERSGLLITVDKDDKYRVLLACAPSFRAGETEEESDPLSAVRAAVPADEYLLCDRAEGAAGFVLVSLSNIESYRRLQQIILRAMICADGTRDVCPFCGQPLTEDAERLTHLCLSCRMMIRRRVCPETGLAYTATSILRPEDAPMPSFREEMVTKDSWIYDRLVEPRMHFRNITPITADGDAVCPHCGRVHTD